MPAAGLPHPHPQRRTLSGCPVEISPALELAPMEFQISFVVGVCHARYQRGRFGRSQL